MRGRGDCLGNDYNIWVGGYPRSANTFVTAALRLANPQTCVATHWHIPAFIIRGLRLNKPGILLIREPLDAALSWAIFWHGRVKLEHWLDYYVDFHSALLPYQGQLFVAGFEEATSNFEVMVGRFNKKFGTEIVACAVDGFSRERCFDYVEDWFREPDGTLDEFKVPRPSMQRNRLKGKLLEDLRHSSRLGEKLKKAQEIYNKFCPKTQESTLRETLKGGTANEGAAGMPV